MPNSAHGERKSTKFKFLGVMKEQNANPYLTIIEKSS